ncbi:hypothetical protein [Frigoriglobus tundricola]|uniref:Uncharacterized protein n=1 Tax=Frigoriglobus tundricola TaxID=2774151 RepID=A0A6M5YKW4_9BACT|nr:hypothetical protein [Frigoriglobus tundricola]QJW94729.1 hypothetical protein FTUN_2251 [Frigoriglobus tundricola]
MTGTDNPTLALFRRTLDDLDPTGEIRKRTNPKGEAHKASPASSSRASGALDRDRVLSRARKWLAQCPPAVQGANGSAPTFAAARGLVHGFDLDADTALGLLLSDYNPRCDPPWSVAELTHKVKDADSKPYDKPRGYLRDRKPDRPESPARGPRPVAPPSQTPVGHPPSSPPPATGLPTIVQQPAHLRDVVDQAICALVMANDPISLFVHGDSLVRIETKESGAVRPLSKSQLRLLLSQSADWMNESVTKDGDTLQRPAFPKGDAVDAVQDHRDWPGLPRLNAVADVPVVTAESGLLTKPGYDSASGVYLLPGGYADVPPVHDKPDRSDVEAAKSLLLNDLLVDFPFVDNASLANCLALFLLPFVRGLIDGPTPLHHVDAPQEGTGKSLLIQTWGWVTIGHEPKALGEVSRADDWQKLILAAAMEAPREIFLDNLNQTLDSGSLASAITSTVIGGRLLGFSRMVSAPVNCTWVSSGNNVSMSRELVRRTVYIRLDAKADAAWKGREFKHALPRWAKQHRGELVWACLTLCQAWIAAGKPAGRPVLGGFEAWSAVMDGILSNAGVTDLVSNSDAFRTTSVDSGDEWRAFVPAWWKTHQDTKVTAGELARLAEAEDLLVSILEEAKSERGRGKKVGDHLKRVRDRVYGGVRIEYAGLNHRDQSQYRLVKLDSDGQEDGHTDATPIENL